MSLPSEAEVPDPRREARLCALVVPTALLVGFALHAAGAGAFVQRTFLTMPVHELGHAVAAWFCGYAAIPTLWKTLVPESRGWLAPILLCAGLARMAYQGLAGERRALVVLAAALLALQALATLALDERSAQALIAFSGDGIGMVIATALMASFCFGKGTQLYRGGLRWGFVAIGAGAFTDIFGLWWKARHDYSDVPFGEMEGTGASDASRLVDWYGWTIETLVRRHAALGVCCLLVLAAVYLWGVWNARQRAAPRRVAGWR